MAGRLPLPQPVTARPRNLSGGGTQSGALDIQAEGFAPRAVVDARRAEMTTDTVGEQLSMRLLRANDKEMKELSGVLSQVIREAEAGDFAAADAYGQALGTLMVEQPGKWVKLVDSLRMVDPATGKSVPVPDAVYGRTFIPQTRTATPAPTDTPGGVILPGLDENPFAAAVVARGNVGEGSPLDLQRLLMAQGPAREGGELAAQTAPRSKAEQSTRRDVVGHKISDVLGAQETLDGAPRVSAETGEPLTPTQIAKQFFFDPRVPQSSQDKGIYSDMLRMAHIRELAKLTNVPFAPRFLDQGERLSYNANSTIAPLEDYLKKRTQYDLETDTLTYHDGSDPTKPRVDQREVQEYLNAQVGQLAPQPPLNFLLRGLTQAPDGTPRALENPEVMERMVRDVSARNPTVFRDPGADIASELLAGLRADPTFDESSMGFDVADAVRGIAAGQAPQPARYEGPTQVRMANRDGAIFNAPRSMQQRMGEHIDNVLSNVPGATLNLDFLTGGPNRTPYWRRTDFVLPDPVTGELVRGPMPAEILSSMIAQQVGRTDPYYIRNLMPYVADAMRRMADAPAPTPAKSKFLPPHMNPFQESAAKANVDYFKSRGLPRPTEIIDRSGQLLEAPAAPQAMPQASPVTPAMNTSSMMRRGAFRRGRDNPLTSLIG